MKMNIIPLAHSTMFVSESDWTKKITFVNSDLMIDDPELFYMLAETIEDAIGCEVDTEVLYQYLETLK